MLWSVKHKKTKTRNLLHQCGVELSACRRHRCPHNPRAGLGTKAKEPCTFSEYANTYRAHPVEPRKNYKPVEEPVRNEGPMDGWTTTRRVFFTFY